MTTTGSRFTSTGLFLALLALVGVTAILGAEERKEPTPHQRRYYLEHRLLPRWTFGSNGAFFTEVQRGDIDGIRAAWADVVGPEVARAIKVTPLPDRQAVLFTFPEPQEPPECFHVMVVKTGDTFRYFTLELSFDLFESGLKTALGEWTADSAHLNHGPRAYVNAEHFLADEALQAPVEKPPPETKQENRPARERTE